MKSVKRFFLASTLLALSCANFMFAMDQVAVDQKVSSPTPNTLQVPTWDDYLAKKRDARQQLKKATHQNTPLDDLDLNEPPTSFVSPSSGSSSSSSSSTQTIQTQVQSKQNFKAINPNQNQIQKLFLQIAKSMDTKNWHDFYQKLCTNWNIDKKIDFSNYCFQNDKEFNEIFLSLKSIWNQIKKLNLDRCDINNIPAEIANLTSLVELSLSYNVNLNQDTLNNLAQITSLQKLYLNGCNLTELPSEINGTNFKNLTLLDLEKNKLKMKERDRLREEAFPDTCETKIYF